MAHDVFISYSSADNNAAEAICTALESRNISCWLAPRDVDIGKVWAEEIVDAIDMSRIFILVSSSSSNNSPQVIREVEQAASKDIPIIPIRIDNTPLSKTINFFTGRYQWLDAQTPPLTKHLPRLVETVRQLLAQGTASGVAGSIQEADRAKQRAGETVGDKEAAPLETRGSVEPEKAKHGWLWMSIVLLLAGITFQISMSIMPALKWSQWQSHPERVQLLNELYEETIWVMAAPVPLIILGVFCLWRWLASKRLSKLTWWIMATVLICFGVAFPVECTGLFLSPTGSAPNPMPVFSWWVGYGLSFMFIGIYCIRRGLAQGRLAGPAPIETRDRAKTGMAKPGWLWAGIILTLAGLGVAWFHTLVWGTGLLGWGRPDDPWFSLFGQVLLQGLPSVIIGVCFIRKGITGYFLTNPATGRVSNWWWLLPVVLGFIGGIIAWFQNKNANWRRARNMLTTGIFITFIFAIPVLARDVPLSLPFSDGFEDGNADGWRLDPGWQVASDNGNYFLKGQGHYWATLSNWSGDNYIFKFRFKINNGSIHFSYRRSDSEGGPIRYYISVGSTNLALNEQSGDEFKPAIRSVSLDLDPEWHEIEIRGFENIINVYLDSQFCIGYVDEHPIETGGIGLETLDDSECWVDDIEITRSNAEDVKVAPYGGTISGHVHESDGGAPIEGAWIEVIEYDSLSDDWLHLGDGQTDEDGYYEISGLPDGRYVVRVGTDSYIPEWYDNTYDYDEAQPVNVTAGQDTPGINFSLAPE